MICECFSVYATHQILCMYVPYSIILKSVHIHDVLKIRM